MGGSGQEAEQGETGERCPGSGRRAAGGSAGGGAAGLGREALQRPQPRPGRGAAPQRGGRAAAGSHKGPPARPPAARHSGAAAAAAAAAAAMGMLSLPAFLSCGKKKVRRAGGTRAGRGSPGSRGVGSPVQV